MTEQEFYAQIQEDWFNEFACDERDKIFLATHVHDEFFEFDDVPHTEYNNIFNSAETI
jgi:hypothetical protein